jgi:lipopolysaccharide transport system permease protein
MVTPVFYPVCIIPERVYFLSYLNPITGVIQGYRWCITGIEPHMSNYLPGFLLTLILFISSIWYFKRVDYRMAEKL